MPRSEDENKRIRDAQRESILEAAKAVFASKGWATTMADIAAEAKISQGLIYHYFEDKEAILGELIGQATRPKADRFQAALQAEGSPTERLEALISGMLKSRRDLVETFGVVLQMAREGPPSGVHLRMMRRMMQHHRFDHMGPEDFHGMMMKRFNSMNSVIVKLIEEGQEAGEFAKDDPQKLSLILLTLIQGLTMLAMHRPEEYKKYYPYIDIIMRMLKPEDGSTGAKGE